MDCANDTLETGSVLMALVGVSVLTYIRPVHTQNKENGYAVCAADGTQLAVFPTYNAAYFTARQYNLTPLSVN